MLRKYRLLTFPTVTALLLGACAEGTKVDVLIGTGGSVSSGGASTASGGSSVASKGGSIGSGGKTNPLTNGGSTTTTKATLGGSTAIVGSGGTTAASTESGGTVALGGISAMGGNVAGISGGAAGAPTVAPPPVDGLGVKMTDKQSVDGNNIKSNLALVNQGGQAVDLTTVKIRYYFTMDSWATPVSEVYYAGPDVGSANIRSEFFTVALPGADRYVQMSFVATGTQSLSLKGGAQLAIQTGLHDQGWKTPDTSNDYSFTGTLIGFTDHITVYVGSKLVWGVEPGTEIVSGAGGAGGGGAAGAPSVAGGAAGATQVGGGAGESSSTGGTADSGGSGGVAGASSTSGGSSNGGSAGASDAGSAGASDIAGSPGVV